jgi:hypothetical protein
MIEIQEKVKINPEDLDTRMNNHKLLENSISPLIN